MFLIEIYLGWFKMYIETKTSSNSDEHNSLNIVIFTPLYKNTCVARKEWISDLGLAQKFFGYNNGLDQLLSLRKNILLKNVLDNISTILMHFASKMYKEIYHIHNQDLDLIIELDKRICRFYKKCSY